jgi:hypothetical protein
LEFFKQKPPTSIVGKKYSDHLTEERIEILVIVKPGEASPGLRVIFGFSFAGVVNTTLPHQEILFSPTLFTRLQPMYASET